MLIEVQHVTKKYIHDGVTIHALNDISFSLEQGQSLAICGKSGAGKSTLLHILGGLDRPSAGHVMMDGQNLQKISEKALASWRRENLGFVFQFHHLLNDFTIEENVMIPLLIQKKARKEAKEAAGNVLSQVGLKGLEARHPRELSGGEQQRAAIARALVHRPKIILADEPTGNLDGQNARQVFDLLCTLNRDLGATLVMVTHHDEFADILGRVLTLEKGKCMSV
jgi:lipoprotein-releasing system ATP-binding protein